jgi:hypothetical protein
MDGDTNERITLVKGDGPLKPAPSLRRPETANEPFWPGVTDAYKAAGEPAEYEIPRLVVDMGRHGVKPGATAFYALPYADMGTGEFGYDDDGQWFRFPFHQPGGALLLAAHGRNILPCCNAISLHRLPWIRLADRDFRRADGVPDDKPIFTRIEVTDWVPGED